MQASKQANKQTETHTQTEPQTQKHSHKHTKHKHNHKHTNTIKNTQPQTHNHNTQKPQAPPQTNNHITPPQHTITAHNHNTQTQPQYNYLCVWHLRGRWSQGSTFECQLETLATPRRELPNTKIATPSPRTHKQNRKPQNSRPWQHAPHHGMKSND